MSSKLSRPKKAPICLVMSLVLLMLTPMLNAIVSHKTECSYVLTEESVNSLNGISSEQLEKIRSFIRTRDNETANSFLTPYFFIAGDPVNSVRNSAALSTMNVEIILIPPSNITSKEQLETFTYFQNARLSLIRENVALILNINKSSVSLSYATYENIDINNVRNLANASNSSKQASSLNYFQHINGVFIEKEIQLVANDDLTPYRHLRNQFITPLHNSLLGQPNDGYADEMKFLTDQVPGLNFNDPLTINSALQSFILVYSKYDQLPVEAITTQGVYQLFIEALMASKKLPQFAVPYSFQPDDSSFNYRRSLL